MFGRLCNIGRQWWYNGSGNSAIMNGGMNTLGPAISLSPQGSDREGEGNEKSHISFHFGNYAGNSLGVPGNYSHTPWSAEQGNWRWRIEPVTRLACKAVSVSTISVCWLWPGARSRMLTTTERPCFSTSTMGRISVTDPRIWWAAMQ